MNPLLRPEFILLHLKQGELPLEGFTVLFQLVAHTTSYPDDALCAFYDASLNASCRAPSSEDGPRADFTAFVEWTLARNKPSFSACSMENLASATPDPEPSQPPPRQISRCQRDQGAIANWSDRASDHRGREECTSDQVREPATMPATVGVSVGHEDAEDSTTHCTAAEVTSASCQHLCSPSAYHLCGGFAAGLPVSIGVMVGGSLIVASSLRVLDSASALRPCGSTPALSSLVSTVARRSTSSTGLHRPSSSALVSRRPTFASGLYSSGCASSLRPTSSVDLLPPAGTASVLYRSGSAADLRISVSALVARALGSAWDLRILGVAKDHRLSVSASGSTTTCSASVGRPHGVVSLSSTMAPPSIGSTVGFHLGCGLGFTWLLLLQPLPVTSLASPSVITSMDNSPSPWTPSFALLPGVRPPPKPPPKTLYILFSLFVGARTRLPGGGGALEAVKADRRLCCGGCSMTLNSDTSRSSDSGGDAQRISGKHIQM
ncbi:ATP synthase subunit a [Labeo rohita]|uniref:ATP synthase subunit a n=1 Tax=Labeo rohita TaxID=84645 RepID=A0ABQ8MB67_LABRO|nr:ATP synthase subunit a [Labeo rohita]